MRAVIQKVKQAEVKIDEESVGKINQGFVILLGITQSDTEKEVNWLAQKICGLRVFADQTGKMNLGLTEVNGEVLIISQFTLYGDCRKGRRPSFSQAARPEQAIPLYEKFIKKVKEQNLAKIATGKFGADMQVSLINDGPCTLILDTTEINNL